MVKVRLLRLLRLAILLYALAVICMVGFQRDLMYFPDKIMKSPAQYGLQQAQEIKLKAKDETSLIAWLIPPAENKPLIVFFHGNGGNLSYRIHKMKAFTQEGMGLLALSYRGYGGSEGKPSETGLYQDARAALVYVKKELKIPPQNIILYGESLGTGVAVQMATETPVAMVVLEAPYTRTVDRAAELYRWLPVRYLMLDRFESIDKLKNIGAPLLIFHNTGDPVIPVAHGRQVYKAALPPKRAIWFARQGHVDFDWGRLEKEIAQYYARHQK